jgi:hypothetical protein
MNSKTRLMLLLLGILVLAFAILVAVLERGRLPAETPSTIKPLVSPIATVSKSTRSSTIPAVTLRTPTAIPDQINALTPTSSVFVPQPLPTIDVSSKWLTYTNSAFGFSMQYPEGTRNVREIPDVAKNELTIDMQLPLSDSFSEIMSIHLFVQSNSSALSVQEIYQQDWASQDPHKDLPPILQSVVSRLNQIESTDAKGFFIPGRFDDQFMLLIAHNTRIYAIQVGSLSRGLLSTPGYQSLFAQLMTTFQFID